MDKLATYFQEIYGLSTDNALNMSSTCIMTNSIALTSNSTPADGQFTFDSNTGIIHCLKNNTNMRGYFAILVENLSVGDVIIAQMECCAISGTKPKIVMDILHGTKGGSDIIGAEYSQSQVDYNKWTTINLSKVHEYIDRDSVRVVFGIGTADSGEYLLRNLKVKVLRQNKNPQLYPEIQTFNFVKQNGVWTFDDRFGANSGATINIIGGNILMELIYTKPFTTNKRPIAIVTADAFNVGAKYRVMAYGSNYNKIFLCIQDIKDYVQNNNMFKDWTTIEDNTYFNLTVIG